MDRTDTQDTNTKSVFQILNNINVQEHVEQKNGLSYLSWAWAWQEVKKLFPESQYKIYERESEYGPINYFTDGMTCWVKTGVEIRGLEHIEELPVMDFKNKSIPLDKVTSFDVNKAIQRSLTKALARHGLGLYIYAGEDLPEVDKQKEEKEKLEKLIPEVAKLQTEMTNYMIDWRGEIDTKTKDWIFNKAQVKTQDIGAITSSECERLIKAYSTLIQGKKNVQKQKSKSNGHTEESQG